MTTPLAPTPTRAIARQPMLMHSYRVVMDPEDSDGGIIIGMTTEDTSTGERFRQDIHVNALRAVHLLLRMQSVLYKSQGVRDRYDCDGADEALGA